MPDFKDMLKYFRMREGLSQSELAEKLGMSASRISMYEVGKREPDFESEEKIADFFNTDLNTLRGRDIESSYIYEHGDTKLVIDLYRSLNEKGQERVLRYLEEISQLYRKQSDALPNAAHTRTDIEATAEDKQHDNNIMDDKNF